MTAIHIDAYKQLLDALLSVGFGIILSFAYHLLTLVIYRANKFIVYIAHVLFFSIAGLFVFCFVIGKTSLSTMRWYLGVGFFVGVVAYYWCFALAVKSVASVFSVLIKKILIPFSFVWRTAISCPFSWAWGHLQKRYSVVYNQRKKKQKSRVDKRSENDKQGASSKKSPIKAYTKT